MICMDPETTRESCRQADLPLRRGGRRAPKLGREAFMQRADMGDIGRDRQARLGPGQRLCRLGEGGAREKRGMDAG